MNDTPDLAANLRESLKRLKREHEPTRRCWCGKFHNGKPPAAAAGPDTTGGDQ